MPVPVVQKTLALTLISLLRTIVPPAAVVGALWIALNLSGLGFGSTAVNAASISFALTLLILQPPHDDGSVVSVPAMDIVARTLAQWFVLLAAMLTIGYIFDRADYFPREVIFAWALLAPALLVPFMLVLNEALRRVNSDPAHARRVVFVGYNVSSCALAGRMATNPNMGMKVLGFFDDRTAFRLGLSNGEALLGRLSEIAAYVKKHDVHVIFISMPIRHHKRFIDLMDELSDTTASVYYVPDISSFDLIQSHPRTVLGIPVVAMRETPLAGSRAALKRGMDFVISSLLLLLLTPLLFTISIGIKVTSRGPVIFKQRRYGLDGHEFLVYKFRTMRVAEDGDVVKQASRNDSRVTSFGAFLRRTSLDELPQLINVVQGRMSLVGPRPHAVAHNEQYRKLIRGYMLRHKVLPGITGLAQVNGCRGETTRLEDMQARVRYDLDYLKHWSPTLDLKILALTALRALGDEKAY